MSKRLPLICFKLKQSHLFFLERSINPDRLIRSFSSKPATGHRSEPSPRYPMATSVATSVVSSYNKYETRKRSPNPKTSVLLVLDMQNHFSNLAKPILPKLLTTVDACRRSSIPVIFTRHLDSPTSNYQMLAEWWHGDRILDGNSDAELLPEIQPLVGKDELVEKNTYSAFGNTGLQERLVEMGVEEVIVTGVMTNLGCETTARDAFVRGFRVFFSADATATANLDLHESTLKNLAFGFAYLVDCERLQDGLFKK